MPQGFRNYEQPGVPTDVGHTTGDPTTDTVLATTGTMGKAMQRKGGVAGSEIGSLNYTHAGKRHEGETRSGG
jgi:hypothetical protein